MVVLWTSCHTLVYGKQHAKKMLQPTSRNVIDKFYDCMSCTNEEK